MPSAKYSDGCFVIFGISRERRSKCSSSRSTQYAAQPQPASRNPNSELREVLDDSAAHDVGERDHLLDRVSDGVQHEMRVEPLAAGRLQVRSVAPVDRHRDAQRLRLVEDRIEVAGREVTAAVVRRQHHADMAELADGALELCDRGRHVLHGERGRALQAIRRGAQKLA